MKLYPRTACTVGSTKERNTSSICDGVKRLRRSIRQLKTEKRSCPSNCRLSRRFLLPHRAARQKSHKSFTDGRYAHDNTLSAFAYPEPQKSSLTDASKTVKRPTTISDSTRLRQKRKLTMQEFTQAGKTVSNRRFFLKKGMAAGAVTMGAGLLTSGSSVLAEDEKSGRLTPGDAALLRFAAAAEILETDFWVQYNELGGVPNTSEVPGGSGNAAYTAALAVLDADMAQYIHDNTDDECTHQNFLNAYLESKGADPVNLEPFRTLPGSTATGSSGKLRLTNLMQLTLDTSWWTRYRSSTHNPDLDPTFTFPQAIPTLNKGQHTAIPRTDADTSDANFLQAIANTAATASSRQWLSAQRIVKFCES